VRVAFYTPLKPPDHPVPSGDRQLARALLQALQAGGHDAVIASRYRSFDGRGDPVRQARLAETGARLAQRLVARFRRADQRPDAWFTYHLHHKAPDWLGPAVCRALAIPYLVAEASVAASQRDGRWAHGYAASVAAIRTADAILFLNPHDVAGVRAVRGEVAADQPLPPFLDLDAFVAAAAVAPPPPRPPGRIRLISVAMMRDGGKLASYRVLGAALARIASPDWELLVIGDGAARGKVEAAFAGIGGGRVRFAGAIAGSEVAAHLLASDLFVWPAVDEAFGMVFIEAQACGLPVVGGNAGGVAGVVDDGRSGLLVEPGNVAAFAAATARLLDDAALRARMGKAAVAYVHSRHGLASASARIDSVLRQVVAGRNPDRTSGTRALLQ
jgi:glycosyltransferase involved in cell wall biosynthesis